MTVFWGIIDATLLGLVLFAAAIVYAEISLHLRQRRYRRRQRARRGYIR